MKILFVCKHNRFRGKVAEFLFRKETKYSHKHEVKSAGIHLDFSRPYVAENVKKVLEDRGIKGIDEEARELNILDLQWADKIIIVADNVSGDIFPGEKTEIWGIEDADESEKGKIEKITEKIEARVKKLVASLGE